MSRYERLFVVGNAEGRIVGLAAPSEPADGQPHSEVVALRGQTVAEVTLPPDLSRLESLVDIHKAMDRFRLQDGKLRPLDSAAK
jgi:hypothetical protein